MANPIALAAVLARMTKIKCPHCGHIRVGPSLLVVSLVPQSVGGGLILSTMVS